MKKLALNIKNVKKFSVGLFFVLGATVSYAQTHIGGLTLTNQVAIDTFNFTEVTGNLVINGAITGASITNLNGLEGLTYIGGYLEIQNNNSLSSLNGLDSLIWIEGNLDIYGNDFLSSLRGLEGLTYIGGYLEIQNNRSLASLSSWDSLTNIGGYLTIRNNNALRSLSGLDSVTNIGGYLTIRNNNSLRSLSSLGSVINIGGFLFIRENNSLTSLSGLDSLTNIGGSLFIRENNSLTSLSGLEMLNSIGGGGHLIIRGNTNLTNFCTLSSLIGDDKQINSGEYTVTTNGYNPTYNAIQNETFCSNADGNIFSGDITLNSQDAINSFNTSYTAIAGTLTIQESTTGNITNLDSLRVLTQIGDNLVITTNSSLTSLSGLETLASIGGRLTITGNTNLTNFCALSPLVGDINPITSTKYAVSGNGYNPPYEYVQDSSFCSNPDGLIFDGDLTLTTQQEIDNFSYTVVLGNITVEEAIPSTIFNLNGLNSLMTLGGTLTLKNNILLADFCGLSPLVGDANVITNTKYVVRGNGYNPPYEYVQDSSFCSNPDGLIFDGDLTLTTQQEIDNFSYTVVLGNITVEEAIPSTIFNLNGLNSLMTLGGTLTLKNNILLADFCGLSPLVGDANVITSTKYVVRGNGYNPSYTQIQSASDCFSSVFIGNFTINSQDILNNFHFSEVTGNLLIGDGHANNISNLDSLSNLLTVGGNITIQANDSLEDLDGLENLTGVAGMLSITDNANLSSYCAVASLVGDTNQITRTDYAVSGNNYNPTYTDIQTTDNCFSTFLFGNFNFDNVTTNNQNALNEFGTRLDIFGYTGIIGNIRLEGMATPLSDNPITSLEPLENITYISGDVIITRVNLLSLSGLDALTEIGGFLNIRFNASLTSLSGLDSLTNIGGHLLIESNGSLTSLSGLDALTETGGYLSIEQNNSLTSLSSLKDLTEVGGRLNIEYNNSLTSLSGLDSLTKVGGFLFVRSNSSLTSLSGLEMLDSIGDQIFITGNTDLIDFCTISSLVGDANQITSGEYNINDNGYNPVYTEIQTTTRCRLDPPVIVVPIQNISIRSGGVFSPINLNLVFSDPNGDSLTYTVSSSDSTIVTKALNGTILTLTEVTNGTVTITVTATDAGGLSISEEFMVSILPNNAPTVVTALMDVAIQSGIPFTPISLSTAFTDANGDTLSYRATSSDTAVVSVALDTLNGIMLLLTETGKGTAMITVTATDGIASISEEFMVSILQNNAPMVATALMDVAIQSDIPFAPISLSTTFTDANGDTLSYRVASSDTAVVSVALDTLNGIMLLLTETGKGTAMITVTATDGIASISEEFMVSILQNNAPMVATALMDVAIQSDIPFAPISLSTAFTDANGDTLSYRATSSDTAVVSVALDTLNGIMLLLTETGKGTAMITVTATDGIASISEEFMVSILPNNAPTVATALMDVAIQSGIPFAPISLSTTFTDANGDTLSYRATSSDTAVVSVALDTLNGIMLLLTETGEGTAMITVTATDVGGLSISEEFMVSILQNNAPIRTAITFPPIPIVEVGYQLEPAVNLTPFFSDPNGDRLTYTTTVTDSSVVTVEIVEISRWTFTAIGSGTTEIMLTATDPTGFSVSRSIMITVEEEEEPPPLGIADTDIVAVYPNPSSGLFQLSRTAAMVRVYDMSGRLVYRGRKIKHLDLTSNPAGQYLVEVRVGKERGRYTIIRE